MDASAFWTLGTRPARRSERPKRATWAYAAAAARTPGRGTTTYAYCKACHPGSIAWRWTRERVLAAMAQWRSRYAGCCRPTTSRGRTRVGTAERRSSGSHEEIGLFGSWAAARAAALPEAGERLASDPSSASLPLGSNSISLPNPRRSTAKSEDLRGGAAERQQGDLQGFSICGVDFAHNSGR